jgi:AsmA protein
VLLVLAAALLPMLFDPNDHKQRIETGVTDLTGLPFAIEGEIGWSVFPWLGFDAGPITLGNPSGFASEHLARIERIEARVQLVPLLSKRVELGAIVLQGADINAEVRADGQSNWQSLSDLAEAGEQAKSPLPPGVETKPATNFSIASVEIVGAGVHYLDATSDTAVSVRDFSLSTGPVRADTPMDIEMDFNLAHEALSSLASVSTSITLSPMGQEAGIVTVHRLRIDAPLTEDYPLQINLPQPLTLASSNDNVSIPALEVTGSGGLRASLGLDAKGLTGTPELGLSFEIPSFDPRELLQAISGEPLKLHDANALSAVSLSGRLRSRGDTASVDNLQLKFDDTSVKAAVELSSLETLTGTVSGSMDRLDLDRYLPAADDSQSTSPDAPGDLSLDIPGNLSGTFTINELRVSGMTLTDIDMTFDSGRGGFRLFPLTAALYGGELRGGVQIKPTPKGPQLVLRNTMKGVNAGPLLQDLAGQPVMAGLGNLAVEIIIDEPLAANPIASANGKVEFRFNDGTVYGVNVMDMIRQAASLLRPGSSAARQPEDASTDFASMILSAEINQGVLTTRQLQVVAPFFKVSGSGSIDLAQGTVDYQMSPVLTGLPQGERNDILEKLTGIAIPVRLTGSLDNPGIDIDPVKLLAATQRGKLDGPAGELLDALSGEGADGKKKDPGKSLFDALLNEAARKQKGKSRDDSDNGDGNGPSDSPNS